jgi:type I restriction enzyme M protein
MPGRFSIGNVDASRHGRWNIVAGNTLLEDGHAHAKFDYMLSNPPFGVEWKKVEKELRKEHESQGFNGRFGPGLPRVSDGSLLLILHLLSKIRPAQDGGSRFGIVLNGSPLFTGGAGSGESEIRRYVLENDLVEACRRRIYRCAAPILERHRGKVAAHGLL